MEFISNVMAFFQSHLVESIIAFLFLALEFWLGKTELVKPGSTLEVILSGIKSVLEFLRLKKRPNA